jgi:hypothetical protein
VAIGAGCGGDDGGGDEEAIREAIRLSFTTYDPEGDCNERLSRSFIERTYGTRPRCERLQADDEDEENAESVEFASVEVDGDAATAEIEARGGEVDGARGALELVREDGDWRIDGVSVALLRTLVEAGLPQTENLPPGGVDCLQRGLRALPDAEFRATAYAMVGERPEAQRRIFELLAGCEGEGGVSLLRQAFEEGIVESLRDREASQGEIDCVLAAERARLSDDQLLELLGQPNANQAAARVLAPALRGCG